MKYCLLRYPSRHRFRLHALPRLCPLPPPCFDPPAEAAFAQPSPASSSLSQHPVFAPFARSPPSFYPRSPSIFSPLSSRRSRSRALLPPLSSRISPSLFIICPLGRFVRVFSSSVSLSIMFSRVPLYLFLVLFFLFPRLFHVTREKRIRQDEKGENKFPGGGEGRGRKVTTAI